MSTPTRLTIPMDGTLRLALQKRAEELGFDSSQALLRYVSKAVVDGRRVTFGEAEWGEPTPVAATRLNQATAEAKRDLKAGKLKTFTNSKDALDHSHRL